MTAGETLFNGIPTMTEQGDPSMIDHGSGTLEENLRVLRDITDKGVIGSDLAVRILGILDVGVVIIDEAGTIRYANPKAELIFRYRDDEMLGLSVDRLLPESLRTVHAQHRVRFFADPRARPMGAGRLFRGQQKDGNEIALDVSLSPIVSGQGVLVVAIVRMRTDAATDQAPG
jgi:PAS domain S-box-containing protein